VSTASGKDHPSSQQLYKKRNLKAIAARWDGKAAQWDRQLQDPSCHLNEDDAYDHYTDQLAMVIRRRRRFCAANGCIDAGCATGLVLAKVLCSFAWGIGVDISAEMIRIAQGKGIPRAKFLIGDCFALSKLCPPAGAVLSRGVLLSHYGPRNGLALLKSARASLVRGGFILWDFLNLPGTTKYKYVPRNKSYFAPEEVCGMAIEAGFETARTLGEPSRRVGLLLSECS
jgi:predicted TPR repeat methyltransferase